MAHSTEIRKRAIEAYETGKFSQLEIVSCFGISLSSFGRWYRNHREKKSIAPKFSTHGRPARIDTAGLALIKSWVISEPTLTLAELCNRYAEYDGAPIGDSIISRALHKLNLRYKKLSIKASESETEAVKKNVEIT